MEKKIYEMPAMCVVQLQPSQQILNGSPWGSSDPNNPYDLGAPEFDGPDLNE